MRLGYLELFAFIMRNCKDLPKAPVKKDLKTILRVRAYRELLQRFAALAERLGFKSPEIEVLKGSLDPPTISDTYESVPLLVTTGPGESIRHRLKCPNTETFKSDKEYLFLHNLCDESDVTGEGITSFFVLKSWFTAFFDPLRSRRSVLSTERSNPPPPSAHHQHVDEDDVNMEDSLPRSPDQREQEQDVQRIDMDEQIQETIESVQRTMSIYAKEENRRLEIEQATQPYSDELFGNLLHL
jgi:hypothetical protein